jgi:hypothetical protein
LVDVSGRKSKRGRDVEASGKAKVRSSDQLKTSFSANLDSSVPSSGELGELGYKFTGCLTSLKTAVEQVLFEGCASTVSTTVVAVPALTVLILIKI